MKYFNFLLENDINFKRDETGNYTALVKVFNPEYFKEKEKIKENDNKKSHYEMDEGKNDHKSIRNSSARIKNSGIKEEQKPKLEKDISVKKVLI